MLGCCCCCCCFSLLFFYFFYAFLDNDIVRIAAVVYTRVMAFSFDFCPVAFSCTATRVSMHLHQCRGVRFTYSIQFRALCTLICIFYIYLYIQTSSNRFMFHYLRWLSLVHTLLFLNCKFYTKHLPIVSSFYISLSQNVC